jgi:hypothetical protein
VDSILTAALEKKKEAEVGLTKEEKEKLKEEGEAETLLDHLLGYTTGLQTTSISERLSCAQAVIFSQIPSS